MAIVKNKYPILEYDTSKTAIIEPNRSKKNKFPEYCVLTFFGEVLDDYLKTIKCKIIGEYKSEMKSFSVYEIRYKGFKMCLIQAVVGSASIAMMTDFLIGGGVKYLICCGCCGVLKNIPSGNVIIPIKALRDEGASYHYLPPKRDISINKTAINAIKETLKKNKINFTECKTWTTDAFYRETNEMVKYRKEEGCDVVEMECATMASIAKFRKIIFGQLLYSGDIVIDNKKYDDREWSKNLNAREILFYLAMESIKELYKKQKTSA
jgi:uridine phosphorylase